MTKSPEEGENEITRDMKRRKQAGQDVCTILARMRTDAARRRDKVAIRKIVQAEKYFNCRNRRKRKTGKRGSP